MTEKLAPHEQLAWQYITQTPANESADTIHLLSVAEQAALRRVYGQTLGLAAAFGVAGVLGLYLPKYLAPQLFWEYPFVWGGTAVLLPVGFTLYGIVLAVLEIAALTMLNVQVVRRMAQICHFPQSQDPQYEQHLRTLLEVSLEKPDRRLLHLGINPYEGLSQWQLTLFSTINKLKATLSNLFIKFILGRIVARYAIRNFIDLVGAPVFGAWNMWGAHRVMHEARLRILAPELIEQMSRQLHTAFKDDAIFREILFEVIQFIAVTKRDFHHNHYLLASRLLHLFKLPTEQRPSYTSTQLVEALYGLPAIAREGLAKLLIFGMLIDGHLSHKELRVLEQLSRKDALLEISEDKLRQWSADFVAGRGLADFFAAKLSR